VASGRKTSGARSLRRRSTEAEHRLWHHLRNRQLDGWKFRRQFPIERFFADFVCVDAKLIVELDGGHHALNQLGDEERTRLLISFGYRVIRYWNSDVLTNTESVLDDILAHLEKLK